MINDKVFESSSRFWRARSGTLAGRGGVCWGFEEEAIGAGMGFDASVDPGLSERVVRRRGRSDRGGVGVVGPEMGGRAGGRAGGSNAGCGEAEEEGAESDSEASILFCEPLICAKRFDEVGHQPGVGGADLVAIRAHADQLCVDLQCIIHIQGILHRLGLCVVETSVRWRGRSSIRKSPNSGERGTFHSLRRRHEFPCSWKPYKNEELFPTRQC